MVDQHVCWIARPDREDNTFQDGNQRYLDTWFRYVRSEIALSRSVLRQSRCHFATGLEHHETISFNSVDRAFAHLLPTGHSHQSFEIEHIAQSAALGRIRELGKVSAYSVARLIGRHSLDCPSARLGEDHLGW